MTDSPKLNIYVVEDMAISRLAIIQVLSKNGHTVIGSAAKAVTALEQIINLPVDIVLIDINLLGEEDGIWLGTQLRQTQDIPFIYLTAYSDEDTVARLNETNPNGYLLKPYNKPMLLMAINIAYASYNYAKKSTNTAPQNDFIIVSKGSQKVKIYFHEIRYLQADDNYVQVYAQTGTYLERIRLKDLLALLPDHIFRKLNRSLIVNMNYVTSVGKNSVYMDAMALPMSRVYQKEVLEHFKGQ